MKFEQLIRDRKSIHGYRQDPVLRPVIEGTQATLTDLFDKEAGFTVSNTDDVEEVTNYRLLL